MADQYALSPGIGCCRTSLPYARAVEEARAVGRFARIVRPVCPSGAFESFARRSRAPRVMPAFASEQRKNPHGRRVSCKQAGWFSATCAGRDYPPPGGGITKTALVPLGGAIVGAGLPYRTPIGIRSVGLTDTRARVHSRVATSRWRRCRPLHGSDCWSARRWPRGCLYGDAREHVLNPRRRQANALGDLAARQPFGRQCDD